MRRRRHGDSGAAAEPVHQGAAGRAVADVAAIQREGASGRDRRADRRQRRPVLRERRRVELRGAEPQATAGAVGDHADARQAGAAGEDVRHLVEAAAFRVEHPGADAWLRAGQQRRRVGHARVDEQHTAADEAGMARA